ncbi:hypothetical protein F5H01DRAFT_70636 [Linnemannia elongata]|nr:hypothetical protein F5H01DRAFT_70636 [Linnemannia elongata]
MTEREREREFYQREVRWRRRRKGRIVSQLDIFILCLFGFNLQAIAPMGLLLAWSRRVLISAPMCVCDGRTDNSTTKKNKQMNGEVRNEVVCKSVIEKQTNTTHKKKQTNNILHSFLFALTLLLVTHPPTLYARKLKCFFFFWLCTIFGRRRNKPKRKNLPLVVQKRDRVACFLSFNLCLVCESNQTRPNTDNNHLTYTRTKKQSKCPWLPLFPFFSSLPISLIDGDGRMHTHDGKRGSEDREGE